MTDSIISRYVGSFVLAATLLAVGCTPRNVEILEVSGPDQLETNEPGSFNVTVNEDAKPPVEITWDFGDGANTDGSVATHTFGQAGDHMVTVMATNRNGKGADTSSVTVMVMDPPVPAQALTIVATPSSPDTETQVRFTANVRGDAPVRHAWSFGDGSTSTETSPTHQYSEAGEYQVSLRVANPAGADSQTMDLSVTPFEAAYCSDLAEMVSVFFERNSSVLTAEAADTLVDNVEILQDCPNLTVRVEGYASPLERNPDPLSADRADAVMQVYTDAGINASRITVMGMGRPAAGTKKGGADQYHRTDTIPVSQ